MLQVRGLLTSTVVLLAFAAAPAAAFEVRTLDGSANNRTYPWLGQAGTPYPRVAPAHYADGVGVPVAGPAPRYVSNRIFNDSDQNLFSERGVTQWAWTWGQFMDHTFGLAQDGEERQPMPFAADDPLEGFRNDFGSLAFTRNAVAEGTGTDPSNPRQAVNTVSSFIDAWNVYGGTLERLRWLRRGSRLLLKRGYLPRAGARGDASSAPAMKAEGRLTARPQDAVVAGDVRANENIALTAVHTLFAREHNRIVDQLPDWLSSRQKFDIARRVVGAEQQYITYREFLPALGVQLPRYAGYDPTVDPSVTAEFATVGYRMHSMIHGEFEVEEPVGRYSASRLARLEEMGVELEPSDDGKTILLVVPLDVAFFNPDLLEALGVGPLLKSLSGEPQYKNDEQFDNGLRSILFQLPSADGEYHGVADLAAIDIQRARDHGMATYNELRRAYGLPPKRSFAAITGESTEELYADPRIDLRDPLDDPDILEFLETRDAAGNLVAPGTEGGAVVGTRRTSLAARLRAIYGNVDRVEAFVGMVSEPHVPGTEMGELQLAIWRKQFAALRDGDRFFYANDPALRWIRRAFGVTYRRTLAELIALNTELGQDDLPKNVFFAQ